MIPIDKIREDWQGVAANLGRRGIDSDQVKKLFELDRQWRKKNRALEDLRAKQNNANLTITQTKGRDKEALLTQLKSLAGEIKKIAQEIQSLDQQRMAAWLALPNLLAADVPEGGEHDYELVKEAGNKKPLATGKSYLDLLGGSLIDIERAARSSGSRFVTLKGQLVLLELGLVRWAIERLQNQGFIPILPPALLLPKAMQGMGYLDVHAEEVYRTQDDLYLIGTSEQSIGAQHMGELIEENRLPIRYVGYSPCFRREVGSHGKDVKGMLRVHQFDKVEMFSLTAPEASTAELEFILSQQEDLMNQLGLPYRVIKLASLDLGRPASKTYDIETWIPSEAKFRETHSCSNTTDYQARRLSIRLKRSTGNEILHMINGTALAIGRILIAIIENYQQADGSIAVPEVLRPVLGWNKIELKKMDKKTAS